MAGMGTLSQQDAAKAKFPTVVPPFNNNWGGYRGYIMQAVYSELQQTYGYTKEQINSKGLHIVTTISKPLMDSLYATVNQNRALMRNDTPPALASGSTVPCGTAGCLPKYVHIGAVLENPANGVRLSRLGQYRNVVWMVDGRATTYLDVLGILPMPVLRYMSSPGRASALGAYVRAGGRVWLLGGGAGTVSVDEFNRTRNDDILGRVYGPGLLPHPVQVRGRTGQDGQRDDLGLVVAVPFGEEGGELVVAVGRQLE